MTDVPSPQMSRDNPQAEGVVVTWFVSDGEAVKADQLLAEVQVDKVTAEVVAPHAGVVRVLVPEEATVVQGTPIASVE